MKNQQSTLSSKLCTKNQRARIRRAGQDEQAFTLAAVEEFIATHRSEAAQIRAIKRYRIKASSASAV